VYCITTIDILHNNIALSVAVSEKVPQVRHVPNYFVALEEKKSYKIYRK
jgi:hypothetical protein